MDRTVNLLYRFYNQIEIKKHHKKLFVFQTQIEESIQILEKTKDCQIKNKI